MKRILFTLDVPAGRGGMEIVAAKVASLFKSSKGKDVEFFLFDEGEGSYTDWVGNINVTLSKSAFRNKKIRRIAHTLRLAKKISQFNPDIIITLNTLPCLISRRSLRLARSKAKLITWMHLPPAERYRPHYLTLADHHLAISSEIKNQLVQLGINKDRIDTIFNPVTKTEIVIERPEKAQFLYIGRVHYEDQKRLKDMLEACALLQGEWTLDIIGDGPDLNKCQFYAEQLNVANKINWHGWQAKPWDYTLTHIKQVSALLLTSDHEGFPLVLLEALSRGVYCIASDCISGPGEIIQPGRNGVLYPPRDINKLREAMQMTIDGVALPSHDAIKQSVERFYEDKFMTHLVGILDEIAP
jgi:UDP-D-galactose:(glucosyl)LPS alpha-1,6-D-galactosyltransferase